MSYFLNFALSVNGLVIALLLAAAWHWLLPRSTGARRFLISVATLYTLASIYAVPFTISRLLCTGYHRFDRTDLPRNSTSVVVLGAGGESVQGWNDRLFPMNSVAAARVLEASRVFTMVSPVWLISSGGSSDPPDLSESSSTNMRDWLMRLGVPPNRILLESESRSTHDEAILVAGMLRSLHIDHIVLVTSDIHMRRSVGVFRAQGIDTTPAIAPDPGWTMPWRKRVVPTSEGLEFSAAVVHELVGLSYYWLRGWLG